jgi:hypothetical protein
MIELVRVLPAAATSAPMVVSTASDFVWRGRYPSKTLVTERRVSGASALRAIFYSRSRRYEIFTR